MTLYDHLEGSAFAALQGIHFILVYDPPHVYILLLLVSVLLVILVKAGIFEGNVHSEAGMSDGDVHSANMFEKLCAGEATSGIGPEFEAYAVAVVCKSYAEEKLEFGIGKEHEQKSDNSYKETSFPCMISKEANLDVNYEGIDKEGEVEEGEEDVEDLQERVEAYIRKVRLRFNIEAIA